MQNAKCWQLLARKLSGEASLEEIKELEQLLAADPELAYRVELYSRYFEHPDDSVLRNEAQRGQSWLQTRAALHTTFPENFPSPAISQLETVVNLPPRIGWKKWLSVAAILLVTGATAFYYREQFLPPKANPVLAEKPAKEMNTSPGTRTKTVLPDGSTVWLNADSRISYNSDFGVTKRELTLTGEAYFDVVHNAAIPFFVKARNITIRVKGTAFNVRNYPDSKTIETSLIRGSVELTTDAAPDRPILLKPNEKITIDAVLESDQLASHPTHERYQIDHLQKSALSKTIPEISWVDNKLVFDNEPFSDIVRKMEKWYNVEIVIRNPLLNTKHFSGVFEKENVMQALEALQLIHPFKVQRNGNKLTIQ